MYRLVVIVTAALVACSERSAPSTVVFVCEHGAAKSVIAAAYFERAAKARGLSARAVARGADPQREPSARTIAGLASDGFAPSAERPRPLTRSDVHDASRVVVFDCGEPAMVALRGLDACWDDAPAIAGGYPATRDAIRARVDQLVGELARSD